MRLGVTQTAFDQNAAFIENGMSNRDNMSVDALQVAQHVEMERTRLEAVDPPVAQPLQVPFGGFLLHAPHVHLHLDELARHAFALQPFEPLPAAEEPAARYA